MNRLLVDKGEDVGNAYAGQEAFTGQEIGQEISWNFTFETAEAMSLVHISVYLAQHLGTKLGPPLDEEWLLVPPGLSLSSAAPFSAAFRAFPPPLVFSCCCLWYFCRSSSSRRRLSSSFLRDSSSSRFRASLLRQRASWLPPLPFVDTFLLLLPDDLRQALAFLHLPA